MNTPYRLDVFGGIHGHTKIGYLTENAARNDGHAFAVKGRVVFLGKLAHIDSYGQGLYKVEEKIQAAE